MLLIIKKVELIEKKEFIVVTFNSNYEIFIVYIATFNINFDISNEIHLLNKV